MNGPERGQDLGYLATPGFVAVHNQESVSFLVLHEGAEKPVEQQVRVAAGANATVHVGLRLASHAASRAPPRDYANTARSTTIAANSNAR